jgi:hypothetical protein
MIRRAPLNEPERRLRSASWPACTIGDGADRRFCADEKRDVLVAEHGGHDDDVSAPRTLVRLFRRGVDACAAKHRLARPRGVWARTLELLTDSHHLGIRRGTWRARTALLISQDASDESLPTNPLPLRGRERSRADPNNAIGHV